jgi:hypothetical protein
MGVDNQAPLIQINQQDNSVNMGGKGLNAAPRESRDRVKNAVMSLLSSINDAAQPNDVVDATTPVEELQDGEEDD